MKERRLTLLIAAPGQEERAALRETLLLDPGARYAVIEAEDGARALELHRARKPDCLILAHDLPGLSALEALKERAAEDERPACGIVMLIDEGDARLAVEAMKSGAHDCLEKSSARGKELLRAVSHAIETAERRRGLERERETVVEARRVAMAAAAGGAAGSRTERDDHKLAEEQVRLLKTAIEQSNESVLITTSQLDWPGPQIVYVNPAFTEMTGYTLEDVIGKTPRILQGPKTSRVVLDRLRKDCEEGRIFFGKAINYRKDGSEFYLEWSIGPVRDERGEVTHFVATQRDVTRRERMEENLHRSEEEFRSLFELSAIGMAQVSPEGSYLSVNRKFCQILGYSEQELLQLTLHDVTHSDDRERSAAQLNSSFANEPEEYSIEKRYVRKDGSIIWVLINWTVVRDDQGQPRRTVANIQDITERKRAEEALLLSEERLNLAMEAGAIGTFDWDIRADVAFWSGRLSSMFDLPTDKSLGACAEWRARVHPEDLPVCEALLRETIEKRLPHMHAEYRIVLGDTGGERWIDSHCRIFYDEQGRPVRAIGANMEITERKRTERALRESEALNRAVLGSLTSHVAVIDRDGKIIAVNEAWKRYAQGHSSEALAGDVGINYLDICRSARGAWNGKAEEAMEGIRDVLNGARPDFTLEYPCHLPGEMRWFLMSATPLSVERGEAVVAYTDITESKQFEEALRESESRLRQLADAMPQIVYTCGPDGLADYANLRWREYSGASEGEDITQTWLEAIHPDDLERAYLQWMVSVSTGRPFELEHRLRRKDGQYRWHLCRAIAVRDRTGRITKWIGTSTDIHDRKRAEAEREELLARAQAARAEAEYAAERIRRLQSVTDRTLAPLALDDLLREMLGRIREFLEADSATILFLTDDGQSLVVRATTESEEEVVGLSIPVGRGVAGFIAASRAPLIVDDLSSVEVVDPILRHQARSLIGAPLIVENRLIGVIHADTSRARQFTKDDVWLLQLAAARIALAIEQTRLYEIEQQARRQAEEANRSKDEFLAVVSHELRSPLNAMLGYAALLRHGGMNAQEVEQAAKVIERSGKAQAQLIDDLLDTARIISGKLRLDIGPVDLVSVIEEAVQTIYPAASAKGISLKIDLPPEVGQITGDHVRLQQVIWNLLSNAVKFSPQGGHVEARLERVDPHICITVSDTGKGIPPDFMPYIFDRFRQADASSARRYGGLGLGLALVKYLVELHGGSIEVASEGEGRGTTFRILLPVRAIATPVHEAGAAPDTVKDSGKDAILAGVRALVVDDEDSARELVRVVLMRSGAEVIAASSAAGAFAMITSIPPQKLPDVVVTDIGMPSEDGYDLIRSLREWERERGLHIPAVALTAYGRVEDRVRALNAGFQMHVSKPVEPSELAAVVASLVRRADMCEKT